MNSLQSGAHTRSESHNSAPRMPASGHGFGVFGILGPFGATLRGVTLLGAGLLLLCFSLPGCAESESASGLGWASSWLHVCGDDADCDGGAYCRCGWCLRGCSDGWECGSDASCVETNSVLPVIECAEPNTGLPGALCAVLCTDQTDCDALDGVVSECRGGVCVQLSREQAASTPDA